MKNKLETRTHKHTSQNRKTLDHGLYRKIIPTVFEINTSIYKLMWRKKN